MKQKGMRTLALFVGCGGLALGFKNVGFDIVVAFDNWEPALSVFRENFRESQVFNCDLSNLPGNRKVLKRFEPDLIIGGPPCQDYSHAGKRNEDLGRADLTISFAEIVVDVKPQWFVMENVDQVMKSKRLEIATKLFKETGYGLTNKVLNASLCGVPQTRKRFFLVGKLNTADRFLDDYLEAGIAKRSMTVREYLGTSLGTEYYYRHPRTYGRRAVYSIDEPSATIRGVNRPIPPNYREHPGDAASVSEGVRPLTTIERSYIQTFPEGFIFEGSKTNLEQMIGNAVPVRLAEYVAKAIRDFIEDESVKIDGAKEHQSSLI